MTGAADPALSLCPETHMARVLKIEHLSRLVPIIAHNHESLCSSHALPAIPLPPWKQ